MIDRLRAMFTPEQRRIIGAEAQQSLDDRHWKEAFAAVEGYLIDKAKACDTTKEGHADNVVIALQLLEAIKRELVRKIEDGEMARIEMAELERRNRPLRFVR